MSPEPTQEPTKDDISTSSVPTNIRLTNDSDSEDEDITMAGYMPLSQIPTDSELILEEDENEEDTRENEMWGSVRPTNLADTPSMNSPPETTEIWKSPCTRSSIDLDADKINQVKSAMATFALPNTAIPDWANSISEEQWKQELMGRIREMQSRNG